MGSGFMRGKIPATRLIQAAKKAQKAAYCPYSRYPVGASVLTDLGRIFTGCNVENASLGLSICAERSAIFNAVGHGERRLKAVCVVGRSAHPCGACRQVMLEFSTEETELLCIHQGKAGSKEETLFRTRPKELLPAPFDPFESGLLPPTPRGRAERRLR